MSIPDLHKLLLILYPVAQVPQFQAAVPQFRGQLLNAFLRLSQHGLLSLKSDQQQNTRS